jgi:hypothetical protein
LVLDALDRYRVNLLVAMRFEQRFGIRPVGFVSSNIAAHIMRRQQPHRVTKGLKLPPAVMRGPAGLQDDRRRRLLREEGQEAIAREPSFLVHATRTMRDGNLKY